MGFRDRGLNEGDLSIYCRRLEPRIEGRRDNRDRPNAIETEHDGSLLHRFSAPVAAICAFGRRLKLLRRIVHVWKPNQMTADEKKLGQHLVGIYKTVSLQQETISSMTVQVLALVAIIGDASPEAGQVLKAHQVAAENTPTVKLLDAPKHTIDLAVETLQKTCGPWDN